MAAIRECPCGILFAAEPYQRRCHSCRTRTGVCERCGDEAPVAVGTGYTRRYCDACVGEVRAETLVREKLPGSGRHLDDLTGRAFGRWTVLSLLPRRPNSCSTLWLCRCECGYEGPVAAERLKGTPGSWQCRACDRAEKVTKPCVVCGTEFTGTKRSRYCSPKCQKEAAAKRKAKQ